MTAFLNPPLTARDGVTLSVLLPGRVSCPRPGKQDVRSLDDQHDIQMRWLAEHTDLATQITVIAGSGSGEILDREEYQQLLQQIVSGKHDLLLVEDLGRIVRRVDAFKVCELCEDFRVRLIAINNHGVDTAQPGWRDVAFFVSYFYEKDNRDKSLRLKERLRSRFLTGGALPCPIFGYPRWCWPRSRS
jgi:DNA invertase Pin-like site-specific DNA recombinase